MEQPQFLFREGLERLFSQLSSDGYTLIGPRVVDDAVLYRPLSEVEQLPWGYRDQQQPGSYRLQGGHEGLAFAWANGPQGLKPHFFAPRENLWRVERGENGLQFVPQLPAAQKLAIIGVRSCDLAALALQDSHFLNGPDPDHHYARRRENTLLVAVNCSHPAATCFCAASGDGPSAESGYDLLLDELDDGFLVGAGSEAGQELLEKLATADATAEQLSAVEAQRQSAKQQQRTLPQQPLQGMLTSRYNSPRWTEVAERCLACGNCTAVCPSCFCHHEQDEAALDGASSLHLRQWDSCFSQGHSYIHGFVVRAEREQRYRQWLTHKFDNWQLQYGRSGCVGCGRCITWCPVGIDVTEELQAHAGGEQ